MAKGPTKAQQALTEAQEWINAAKEEVAERHEQLMKAQTRLEMHETIYAVLEKTLMRKKAEKGAGKAGTRANGRTARQPQSMTTPCAVEGCGRTSVNAIHDPNAGYAGYHEFVPFTPPGKPARKQSSKLARAAAAGSSVSDGEMSTTVSSGDEMDDVISAIPAVGEGGSGD